MGEIYPSSLNHSGSIHTMIHTCSPILSPFKQEWCMRTEPSLNDALIKIAEVCQVGGMRVLVNAVGVLHPRQNLTKGRHFPLTPFRYFILFRERLQWLCWVAFRMLCAGIREFQEKVSLCLDRSFLSPSGATFLTRHALLSCKKFSMVNNIQVSASLAANPVDSSSNDGDTKNGAPSISIACYSYIQ